MKSPPRSASRSRGVFFVVTVSIVVAASISTGFAYQTGPGTSTRAGAQLKGAVTSSSESGLQSIEAGFPGTEEAALARLLRGYLRLQARDYGAAITLLGDASIARQTLLGDYALLYRSQALSGMGRAEDSERDLLRLVQNYPTSILAPEARRQAAISAIARNSHENAIGYVDSLANQDDGGALQLRADALVKLGRNDEAVKSLRRLYFYAAASPEASAVAARLTALGATSSAQTAIELNARADRLYEAGQFVLAAQSYDLLLRQFPAGASNEAALRAGISNHRAGSPAGALDALSRVRARTPRDQAEALYYTAAAQIVLRRTDAALQTLMALRQTAATSPLVGELLFDLARAAERANQPAQAASYFEQIVKQHPRHARADDAHFWLAWRAHEARAHRQSAQMLVEHIADYSEQTEHRGKAAFWAALDAERAGEKSRALTLYQGLLRRYSAGWYGVNAERHIAQLRSAGVKPQVAEPGSTLARAISGLQQITIHSETSSPLEASRLTKAEQLLRLALLQPAMDELQAVRASMPNGPRVNLRIAQVFRARNENAAAINTLKRAYPDYGQALPDEMSREVWDIFYPLNWWPAIQQEARRYNIDPYLVAGLIRQETIFNAQARSRANALGLMQLLPSTGQLVARKYSLGGGRITPADLYNPILNLQLGTAYLSEMIRDFGRFEYAAAAYNGGPTRVTRWLRELPTSSIEDWVDSIPISETRGYVQGVYRNARQYQRLYDEHGRFRSIVPER